MNYHYYDVSCEVTVGKVRFDNVNAIRIFQSVRKLSDTARITLPRAFGKAVESGKIIPLKDKNITDYINEGDAVLIRLGYDGVLQKEFSGYVDVIGADIPLVIKCTDEMYKLKRSSFSEVFENIGLKGLVSHIAPGYEYKIIDDVNLGKVTINDASAFSVLEMLKRNYGLYSFFRDKVLHIGFPISLSPTVTHRFVIDRNVRDSKDLKFVRKGRTKLRLKGISINSDGKRIVEEYGDAGGTLRTLHFTGKSKIELKELLKKNHKSLVFNGLKGEMLSCGIPRTVAGDAAEIINNAFPEQNGKYIIDGVTIKLNANDGYLRENVIGSKI